MTKELLFVPLGGAGEIGMNLNVFGYDDQWIIVDLGVSFGTPTLPGIDLVMPDPSFIEARRDKLLGIVLTHAHEDHLGAVPHLWTRLRCPVYATPFTAGILRSKLSEVGLLKEVPLIETPLGGRVSLGPFEIDFLTLTHSIAEPSALVIRTPVGTVFHTGDWKIDPDPLIGEPFDEDALARLGEEGVLAMICDSTNVFNPSASGSEADVRRNLLELVGKETGRVAITSFASNIARLETLAEVAKAHDRHAVLVGRSLRRNVQVAQATGYLTHLPPFIDEADAGFLPRDKVLYICTGSQGEPRGAMMRIASGDHPHVNLADGDTVIFSSKIIPGNELALSGLYNSLAKRGVRIITEKDEFVHVSGHPGREELSRMYQWIRPEIAVPVHGEARHLFEHADLAHELQVPRCVVPANGTVIRLAPGTAEIVDRVKAGRLVLDGNQLVAEDSTSIVERRRSLHNGHLVISIAADDEGRLLTDPGVTLFGVPDPGDLAEDIADAIEATVKGMPRGQRRDDETLREAVRIAARRVVRQMTDKKPVTDVQILRLPSQS
ncbi:ribonuclease J [Emcibacter sp. SYSU 3D8]|uniref:ribonuclease J n=1 Tax=Emcibacter sp. SYSU 3D8 TaxID=3133969 RepID=UPI0031FF31C0